MTDEHVLAVTFPPTVLLYLMAVATKPESGALKIFPLLSSKRGCDPLPLTAICMCTPPAVRVFLSKLATATTKSVYRGVHPLPFNPSFSPKGNYLLS